MKRIKLTEYSSATVSDDCSKKTINALTRMAILIQSKCKEKPEFYFIPKFFIIDRRDRVFIVVEKESEIGYDGYTMKMRKLQWEANPTYIAKTFIENWKDRFDFTMDIDNAIMECNRINIIG